MLGEFAAALMALANAISDSLDDGDDNACWYSLVGIRIFFIINSSYPSFLPYYHQCWDRHHKDFIWTSPKLQVVPYSQSLHAIIPLLTIGELLELPGEPIYQEIDTTVIASFSSMSTTSHPPPAAEGHGLVQAIFFCMCTILGCWVHVWSHCYWSNGVGRQFEERGGLAFVKGERLEGVWRCLVHWVLFCIKRGR